MRYLALGDSISIDRYTGVAGGGAAAQLARALGATGADFVDLTGDGATSDDVVARLDGAPADADVVTVTAGGNDLLRARPATAIVANLRLIAERLAPVGGRVILNTVYDPTDGDDDLGERLLGLPRELRRSFDAVNGAVRELAARPPFLLADLERLFYGHGLASTEPWYVGGIEPNLAGATAIARHWHELLGCG